MDNDLAYSEEIYRREIESAFREGYISGYQDGSDCNATCQPSQAYETSNARKLTISEEPAFFRR